MKLIKTFTTILAATLLASCANGSQGVRVEEVTLNKTSITLTEQDTYQLVATIAPDDATNKNVTWSSSNPEFASVDQNGLVTALSEGNTTVTVKTKDGGKTATCEVKVNAPVVLESISLSDDKVTSYSVGDTFRKPTVTASFSNGTSKTVTNDTTFTGYDLSTAGTYTVTASYTSENVTKTASFEITVKVREKVLSSISLSNKTTSFNLNDEFVKPTVTARFDDNSTQVVTDETTFSGYNMASEGTYTVVASYTYNNVTKTSSYEISVSVPFEGQDLTLFTGSELEIDSIITFANVSSGSGYVISSTQNTNNRAAESITISGSTLKITEKTATFKVEAGTVADSYSFYTSEGASKGYIYAAGSGSRQNYLKTQATKADNASFKLVSNDNGQVTLQAQGTSTSNVIKYNSNSGGKKVFSCYSSSSTSSSIDLPYLFYKSGTPIYPTAIALNGASEVAINDTVTLTVSYTPSNTNKKGVTWNSSNTSVATVANGVVRGLAEGTTTITAIAKGENGEEIKATKDIQVKTIAVSSVSINKSSSDLSLGKTLQLTATVLPSNATNKSVSWKSSNESVATVSTTGLVTASATQTGSATITVTTADGGKTATCTVNVVEQQLDEWTVMMYVSGSNLESDGGAATGDMKELLSIANQPDDVNILYQTGGTTKWQSMSGYISGATSISASRSQRWEVQNQKIVLKDNTLGQQNMASATTLENYIKWGVSNYPAQKYAVIFWDHGGAMQGCCIDDNYGDYWTYDFLTNAETNSALKNVFNDSSLNINGKFEFVGYDCCIMQVQDIAEFNSQYFDYMVASQELENGDGWDYTAWIDDLYAKKTTPEILTALVDGFVSQYGTSGNDQTLSWLDLTAMADYKTAWENMSKSLINNVATYCSSNKKNFANFLRNKVTSFGSDGADKGYDYYGIFDVKDFLNELKKDSTLYNGLSSLVSTLETAFSNLVKYSVKGSSANTDTYGLCFFFDSGNYCGPDEYYTANDTNFVEWRKIVTTYGYTA